MRSTQFEGRPIGLVVFTGCLISGQITIVEDVNVEVTTNKALGKQYVDLNRNADYEEHKDDIASVDALAIAAIIENNTSTTTSGEIWFTPDSTCYDTVADLKADPTALRVMSTPDIAGSATLTITWNDAFALMENEDAVIAEVLGDGKMTFYGIATTTPFALDIQAQVAVTVTISK